MVALVEVVDQLLSNMAKADRLHAEANKVIEQIRSDRAERSVHRRLRQRMHTVSTIPQVGLPRHTSRATSGTS